MTTNDIFQVIQESASHLKIDIDRSKLHAILLNQRDYQVDNLGEFKRDLIEASRNAHLFVLDHPLRANDIPAFLRESNGMVLIITANGDKLHLELFNCLRGKVQPAFTSGDTGAQNGSSDATVLSIIPYQQIVSEDEPQNHAPLTPSKRLFKLLATERTDVGYVLVYALIIGLLSLVLPLGLQTTIEFISGGVFFSSVYVLVGLIILGVLTTGVLQIVQVSVVEQLQRRIFVKAALEFAYRIPRVRLEALAKSYAPELVNRFFDIITIQKGLPKLLLDLASAFIQVLFGLLLLSLYHPFFVFFSIVLLSIIFIMFRMTGPRGLQSSLLESKYKYKVVQWLEELARAIKSFKLAGNTDLPMMKTDILAGNYITYRKKHFGVLLTQFWFFVLFKVAITGGLLILGTVLVVDREITLGQFVASEVIIILTLNAVEKIILYTDVVYDLLTAVDKVSHVTDLPIEKPGGIDFHTDWEKKGYSIKLHNVSYRYPHSATNVLSDINLSIGHGERVCICGPGGSGKSTLTNIIGGLYTDYSGGVSINNFSMRDLDITHLRDKVAKNISPDDIFDGTLYENITIGKPTTKFNEVIDVTHAVGLGEYLLTLPDGLNTHVLSGGTGLSSSVLHRIIMARCLVKKPQLVILNDFFSGLSKSDKLDMIRCVISENDAWTLIAVSNDPLVMASCDRVIVLDRGQVVADDSYSALMKDGTISKFFE